MSHARDTQNKKLTFHVIIKLFQLTVDIIIIIHFGIDFNPPQ